MLKLLSLLRVVRYVPRDVRRWVKAVPAVDFNQTHSAVQLEAEQLPQHNVVLLRKEGADQLPTERARSAKILRAQVVLFLTCNLRHDNHNL